MIENKTNARGKDWSLFALVLLGGCIVWMAGIPSSFADHECWLEVSALPGSDVELERLLSLGWETRSVPEGPGERFTPGAWIVYLPEQGLSELDSLGIPYRIVHEDLVSFFQSRLTGPGAGFAAEPGRSRLGVGSMGGYFTFDEAVSEMDLLAAANPDLLEPKQSLGTTFEGRSIWAWKLSASAGIDEDEPEVFMTALMHAREPIGMMSLLYLTERLLRGYGTDPELTYLMNHREIWLLPVLNPDGYVHNQTTNPAGGGMWRKNRFDNGDGSFGVDLNRSFSYAWGFDDVGSSPVPSADNYRGAGPFSQNETLAFRDFTAARMPSVSINVHAYGDYVVRPWGYADLTTSEDAVFEDISLAGTRANAYLPGNWMTTLGYLGNGNHDDYQFGETSEKPRCFGFTPEIGNSTDRFWPATGRIVPLVEETEPMLRFLLWAAGPAPRLAGATANDAALGDGDGYIEPGETFTLSVDVRNHGLRPSWGPVQAVLSGTDCPLIIEKDTSSLGTIDSQQDATNLGDPFVVRVSHAAAAGEMVWLSLGLADDRGPYPEIAIPLLVGEPTVLFAEDFESGTALWQLTGWGTEPAGGGGSGEALSDSPGGVYGSGVDWTAQPSVAFDLSGWSRAFLSFSHRFWIDNDFDAGRVEDSADGGLNWEALPGRESDEPSGAGRQTPDGPVYDGRLAAWTEELVDLSAFTGPGGEDVRIRFRLLSDAAYNFDGWLIDNVSVLAYAAAGPPQQPNDPGTLYAAASGNDVVFRWAAALADMDHDAPDGYLLYRSPSVKADAGFAARSSHTGVQASDPLVLDAPASFAYKVVAANCAGLSSIPAP